MRKLILSVIAIMLLNYCGAQTDSSAYKYILDYRVPQSPGFTVLGATPSQVMQGSSAKPFVLNLFTQYFETKKIDPGLALDFSPYFLFGGKFKNIKEYRESSSKQFLANLQLSVATLKNSADTGSTDIGAGIRLTFWDDHSLLNDNQLTRNIGKALSNAASAPTEVIPDDNDLPNVTVAPIKQLYNIAYDSMRVRKGSALSAGYGVKATSHSSILEADSMKGVVHRVWVALSCYSVAKGVDLLVNFQGGYQDRFLPENKMGAALVSQSKKSIFGAELVYNFGTSKIEGGCTGEVKIVGSLSAVFGISAVSSETLPGNPLKLKVNTNIKWNIPQQ